MKNILVFSFFYILIISGFAQNEKNENFTQDLLSVPSSPAFTVLGIEPMAIETPSDYTDFVAALSNATNAFAAVPSSFAMDINPAWLLAKKQQSYDEYFKGKFANSIVLSTAILHEDEEDAKNTEVGYAMKFTIVHGKPSNESQLVYAKLQEYGKNINAQFHQFVEENIENDSAIINLRNEKIRYLEQLRNEELEESHIILIGDMISVIDQQISIRQKVIYDSIQTKKPILLNFLSEEEKVDITELSTVERKGFNLDFGMGVATQYPDNRFVKNVFVNRVGIWLTPTINIISKDIEELDAEDNKGIRVVLGSAIRYWYVNNTSYISSEDLLEKSGDIHYFDFGGKLDVGNSKFTASIEGIFRSAFVKSDNVQLENEMKNFTWKLSTNLSYKVSKTFSLDLVLGRDFNGEISKDGNVIAFLNKVAGLGRDRNLDQKINNVLLENIE